MFFFAHKKRRINMKLAENCFMPRYQRLEMPDEHHMKMN